MLNQDFAASPDWTLSNLTFDSTLAFDKAHSKVAFAATSVLFSKGGIPAQAVEILTQACASWVAGHHDRLG